MANKKKGWPGKHDRRPASAGPAPAARPPTSADDGQRLVYGANPVRELVLSRPQAVSVVYMVPGDTGPTLRDLRELCLARGCTVEDRERAELDALTGGEARHQGVVAITGEFDYAELDDVLAGIAARGAGRPALLVVLDGVQDPHNLGAIVRSACVLGADAVVVGKDRSAPVTPVVVKASAGATERLPIARVTNLTRALEQIKAASIWTYAAVADEGATAPWAADLRGAIALVLGAEGAGVRQLVAKTCDFRVKIPMLGSALSLNVSVAAGALLYEVTRQRLIAR
jgi:23S rRNA (guanosine2251-2'-O)-methyltransferase